MKCKNCGEEINCNISNFMKIFLDTNGLCKECFYWSTLSKKPEVYLIGDIAYRRYLAGEEKSILVENKILVIKLRKIGKVPEIYLNQFNNKAEFI